MLKYPVNIQFLHFIGSIGRIEYKKVIFLNIN